MSAAYRRVTANATNSVAARASAITGLPSILSRMRRGRPVVVSSRWPTVMSTRLNVTGNSIRAACASAAAEWRPERFELRRQSVSCRCGVPGPLQLIFDRYSRIVGWLMSALPCRQVDDGILPVICPTCQMASQDVLEIATCDSRLLCMGSFLIFCVPSRKPGLRENGASRKSAVGSCCGHARIRRGGRSPR